MRITKKKSCYEKSWVLDYFFGFTGALTEVLEAALFAGALTGFIGCSQHTSSHVSSHSHGFSISTTRPHSSHLYCSPFFFAKKSPSKKPLYNELFSKNIRISRVSHFRRCQGLMSQKKFKGYPKDNYLVILCSFSL
jgi:hypothetical protein